MKITIDKHTVYNDNLNIPGSKSITHRALICAALLSKDTIITNANVCEDTLITVELLKSIGVTIAIKDTTIRVISPSKFSKPTKIIDSKNSGSSIRFMLPIFWTLFKDFTTIVDKRMYERLSQTTSHSIEFAHQILENDKVLLFVKKVDIEKLINNPFTTQYTSGILLARLLNIKKVDTSLINEAKLQDPYIKMTIGVINEFINHLNDSVINFNTEMDFSLASNFLVMGCLNGSITINNLPTTSLQGDAKIISYLKQMNASIEMTYTAVTSSMSQLVPTDLDMSTTPDLIPLLAGMMATIDGTSTITGLDRLPYKETNRLTQTIEILRQLGANIQLTNNKLEIKGCQFLNNQTYIKLPSDHRLIMMVVSISSRFKNPITIDGIEGVNKSYPHFINDFNNCWRKYEDNQH